MFTWAVISLYINMARNMAAASLSRTVPDHLEFPFSSENETHILEGSAVFVK